MASLLGLLVLACAPRFARSQAQAQQRTAATAKATESATPTGAVGVPKADVRAGTKISAVLVSRIDARTSKPGEEVVARVTKNVKQNGRTVIHKGDEIVGNVTAVLAGTYKTGSQVTVAFGRLVSGRATARLDAVLAHVVALPGPGLQPDTNEFDEPLIPTGLPGRHAGTSSGMLDPDLAGSAPRGGVTGNVGGTAGTLGQTVDASVGGTVSRQRGTANAVGTLTPPNNTRVRLSTPLEELHVSSNVQGENQASASSVLSSHHGNLRLDSGTQVQFRVAAETRAPSASK